jgi:hypothetical protein
MAWRGDPTPQIGGRYVTGKHRSSPVGSIRVLGKGWGEGARWAESIAPS